MTTKRTHRILVIDDDLDERFLARRALKKILPPTASIHLVDNGNEAIAYMTGEGKFADRREHPFPTLIITDIRMNGGDGFDVLDFIQSNPGWSIVPRVVFSSSDDEHDVRTAFFLGASVYHLKPRALADSERLLCQIVEYWALSQVPPVDEEGRVRITGTSMRGGGHYKVPQGSGQMKRPTPSNKPSRRTSKAK